jgi:hypothetical protein
MVNPLGVLQACPAGATTEVEDVDGGPPWGGVLPACPAVATNEVENVDGGPPGGCYRLVRQWPPPKLKTSMAGPLGVLSTCPAAATTEVEDVDGAPLGGAAGMAGIGHHQS